MDKLNNQFLATVLGVTLWAINGLNLSRADQAAVQVISKNGPDFSSSTYLEPGNFEAIRKTGCLQGFGEATYDITVPTAGWYELWVEGGGSPFGLYLDDKFIIHSTAPSGVWKKQGNVEKMINLYLEAGPRKLRFSQPMGLPWIKSFSLKPSADFSGMVRLSPVKEYLVFRKGESFPMHLNAARGKADKIITLTLKAVDGSVPDQTVKQTVPAGEGNFEGDVPIPTGQPGIFDLHVTNENGADLDRVTQFVVIDTETPPTFPKELKKELVEEIDCVKQEPDYSTSPTRVVQAPFGAYRESGPKGRVGDQMQADSFAYKLKLPSIQEPYEVEVEYPDDDQRTFLISLIERAANPYAPTAGVASGGIFSLSNKMQPHELFFYPRETEPRLFFQNWYKGQRAAAAKIRIYRITSGFPSLHAGPGERMFGMWQEEPMRLTGNYGAMPTGDAWPNIQKPVERLAQLSNYIGANLYEPTIAVYQTRLWPSKYLPTFGMDATLIGPASTKDPLEKDYLRLILLNAEKYRMNVVGQLFVCQQRNLFKYLDMRFGGDGTGVINEDNSIPPQDFSKKPWLLAPRVGKDGKGPADIGYLNPLYPAVQDWVADMFKELADRYKDSPAFKGVAIRILAWQYMSWQTFPSIHYGYEDYTVGLFEKETGITVPVADADPNRYQKRYEWLMANAYDKWVDWRCQKIYDYHSRLAKILTDARPDMKLYLDLFGPNFLGWDTGPGDWDQKGWIGLMREAGLDPARYRQNPAIVLSEGRDYPAAIRSLAKDQALEAAQLRTRFFDPTPVEQAAHSTDDGSISAVRMDAESMEGDMIAYAQLGMENGLLGGNRLLIHGAGVLNGAGRNALMRYANAMADGNITWMSDGSHGQPIGQPEFTGDFMREYRALPAVPMSRLAGSGDPVALWSNSTTAKKFYIVNRADYPVKTVVRFDTRPELTRLGTGEKIALDDKGELAMDLAPFELAAFDCQGGAPSGLSVTVPENVPTELEAQVHFVEDLLKGEGTQESFLLVPCSPVDMRKADVQLATVRDDLKAGHYWSARIGLVHPHLQKIYEAFGVEPPGLFHQKAPIAPDSAMRPDKLKELQAGESHAESVNAQHLAPSLQGEKAFVWKGSDVPLTVQAPLDGRYRLSFAYITGGAYKCPSVSVDGKVVANGSVTQDASWGCQLFLEPLTLTAGFHTVTLSKSQGSDAALLYLALEPVYHDIPASEWLGIGPFKGFTVASGDTKSLVKTLDTPLPLEADRDFDKSYLGADGQRHSWVQLADDNDGGGSHEAGIYVNLQKLSGMDSISYAATSIDSPQARQVEILFGVDYWAKIWLNGQLVKDAAQRPLAPPAPGETVLRVNLSKGRNDILVKTHSGAVGNGFWMSISDPGDLKITSR